MTKKRLLQMAARIPRGIERKEVATKSIEVQILEIKSEIIAKIGQGDSRLAELQRQVDGLDASLQERHVSGGMFGKSLQTILQENDSLSRLVQDRKGRAIITLSGADAAAALERKTTITAAGTGFQTTGVLPLERIPGITPEARQVLTIRDVLTARPTTFGYVDFVKVVTPMTIASAQVE